MAPSIDLAPSLLFLPYFFSLFILFVACPVCATRVCISFELVVLFIFGGVRPCLSVDLCSYFIILVAKMLSGVCL